ncbi:uncharacterized protein LOC131846829 [Achroia grisella]|uniref:uncharacterized protein LOC131846829 n=1 Tax=Achroia grisella TaxID=688607 RepID=UPI0027D20A8E|nr:uncharacterized protein LOC131846829 [Achroia grisella]
MSRVILLLVIAVQIFAFTESVQVSVNERNRDTITEEMNMGVNKYENPTSEPNPTSVETRDDMRTELDRAMTECNETFRVEMSYLEALNESGSFPDETDRTPKCFVRCVLEKTGVASEEGKYDPTRTAVVFAGERAGRPMNDIQDMASGCIDRRESCKCERAYQYIRCLMEAEIRKYE